MPEPFDREYEQAIRFLRGRLELDVYERLQGGDFAANLLEHLRTRREPKLPFSPGRFPEILQLAAKHQPEELAWEREIADQAVAGRMYAASNAHCQRFVEVDRARFDFSSFPHADPQAIHGLGRHRWFASLARHYWEHRDRRYFDALMDHWDFYAAKVPPPDDKLLRSIHTTGPTGLVPPYGELDCFIRLQNWWWAYWILLPAAEMTPRRSAVLLERCLRLFDLVAARGIGRHEHNFTSMQMESLYSWATALPEFTGMNVWMHNSRNIMESSCARAVFDDGVQWEKSAGYHAGCIRWYGTSFLLGRRNGVAWADKYADRLRRMGEYLDAIATPDGCTPLVSDSDRGKADLRGPLSLLRCIFPDMTFRSPIAPTYFSLWVSDGLEWDAPSTVSSKPAASVFPDGGVAVARHIDPSLGAMVLLDNGPTNAGHSHEDNMTVHFEAFSRPIIVDPGRWIYDKSADRAWVTHCQSHNTVYIEDAPVRAGDCLQSRAFATTATTQDPRVQPPQAQCRDGLCILRTAFRGHLADPGASVRRTVVFPIELPAVWLAVVDEIESPRPHTWTNSWLFPTSQPLRKDGQGYRVELEGGLTLCFTVASDAALDPRDEAMFWCPQYAVKAPARWVRFSAKTHSTRRAFLFQPMQAPREPAAIELTAVAARWTIEGRTVEAPLTAEG